MSPRALKGSLDLFSAVFNSGRIYFPYVSGALLTSVMTQGAEPDSELGASATLSPSTPLSLPWAGKLGSGQADHRVEKLGHQRTVAIPAKRARRWGQELVSFTGQWVPGRKGANASQLPKSL